MSNFNVKIVRSAFLTVLVCLSGNHFVLVSQTTFDQYKRRSIEQFESYKATKAREFEEYRARINNEFAEYMAKPWGKFKPEPAEPAIISPEPPKPIVADPKDKPSNDPIPFVNVIPLPKSGPRPQPLLPVSPPDEKITTPMLQTADVINFNYYGHPCTIPFDSSFRFSLPTIDEHSVANAWKQLAAGPSVTMVRSAIALRDSLLLPDWGYLRFAELFAEAVYPEQINEAALLKMFILTQSGYKVRIGRLEDRLIVLIPSDEIIYQYRYIPIKGTKFYVTDTSTATGNISVYTGSFPGEQMFSLAIKQQPNLPQNLLSPHRFFSKGNYGIDVNVAINKNIIDFYNDYPLNSLWNIYTKASLSDNVKKQLYPVLRKAIVGKTDKEAANILLRFVQTAFEYKTDEEQFGYERPFFPDETFYYPYSDCEDRAILYSVIIRDLLNLDVVLLYYPGHLATAVCFNDDVKGDYLIIDGKRYIVCDPTYINANIGMSMSQFKNTNAEVIKL